MPRESEKPTISEFTDTPLVRVADGALSRNMAPADLIAEPGARAALDARYQGAADISDHVSAVDGSAHMAAGITVEDSAQNFSGVDLEAVLEELAPAGFVKSSGGGFDLINPITDASGATSLDLSLGNVQHIESTNGNYTLSVTAVPITGTMMSFWLIVDTSNAGDTPTWFGPITWMTGLEAIDWAAASRHVFSFVSLDGGVSWSGWHLTPTAPIQQETFSVSGDVSVKAGTHRVHNNSGQDRTLVAVRASVDPAPTGASLIVDLNIDGTTAFTTQGNRPTIPAGADTVLSDQPDVTTWPAGAYLTVDVDQVGSTVPGSDLTVSVLFRDA